MIVVVEGISASGKSRWCGKHGGRNVIPENGRLLHVPDRVCDPAGNANFWAERNVDRWKAALTIEKETSLAVCDTDPLKLHYIWCLWQIGGADERDWLLALSATRETVINERIGFADYYFVGKIEPEIARQRANADLARRRRQFALHVRLQPTLLHWYAAIDKVLTGRVQFGFPSKMPPQRHISARYDLAVFDRMIEALSHKATLEIF